MDLRSDAFATGTPLPFRFTKDDSGVSPPLMWSDVPPEAAELALVLERANVASGERRFAYWLVYAIPAQWTGLAEGFGNRREPGSAAPVLQGVNSLGHLGYDGPYGSIGTDILLRFQLFALSMKLDLGEGVELPTLMRAMKELVVAQADLETTYIRTAAKKSRSG